MMIQDTIHNRPCQCRLLLSGPGLSDQNYRAEELATRLIELLRLPRTGPHKEQMSIRVQRMKRD